MSCLLPQFKCSPDSFASSFKCPSHSSSRSRDIISFRTQCILSTSSPSTTAILEFDKLQSPSLEAAVLDLEKLPSLNTHSIHTDSWRYSGVIRTTSELNLGSDMEKDTLLMNDEAVINAAASQAVALAKAAFELAKDAAVTGNPKKSADHDSAASLIFNDVDDSIFMKSQELTTKASELESCEYYSTPQSESEDREPTSDEHELLKAQLCTGITVRSTRQIERKTKRTRAAEKAYANIVSVKSCSSTRKKRSNTRDMDYSDPLCYLRGVTTSCRLLTASEERVFSQGIQAMLKLERLHEELRERLGSEPTLAQWAAAARVDQKTLMKQINHGISCKDKMIKSNIRLVFSIAKNYQGAGMNLHDLVQEGCRGLVRGLEKFDASKGFKFSTYAHWWIKQAVRKSLSDQSRTIRLPLHMVYATYRVKEARNQFFSENGRFPDDEEVSEATGLSMKRLSTVLLTPKSPRSLDQKIGANLDLKPSDIIADPDAETSEDLLMKQFMKRELVKVLDTLNPREKQIVKLRFGLEGGRRKTLQEIGELMGVSRERIRQIESCAFRKLKNKKRIKTLQQYVMT